MRYRSPNQPPLKFTQELTQDPEPRQTLPLAVCAQACSTFQVTDLDLHWLAGLLEGEGSFMHPSPSRPRSARISLESTDRDIVERAASLFGINFIYVRKNGPNKDSYQVQVSGARAELWMRKLLPLMGIRRQSRIRDVLELLDRHRCCKDNGKSKK